MFRLRPTIAIGFTCLTGELLPAITRTMNFQVVARDNRLNGGGINTATVQVMVDGNSGPFAVTAPNTGVPFPPETLSKRLHGTQNTTNAPVNAANVKISLSTDGGHYLPDNLLSVNRQQRKRIVTDSECSNLDRTNQSRSGRQYFLRHFGREFYNSIR